MKELQQRPDDYMCLAHVGGLLANAGRMKEAGDYLGRAIGVSPTKGLAYFHRGNMLLKLGDFQQAVADLEMALVGGLEGSDEKLYAIDLVEAAKQCKQQAIRMGNIEKAFQEYVAKGKWNPHDPLLCFTDGAAGPDASLLEFCAFLAALRDRQMLKGT